MSGQAVVRTLSEAALRESSLNARQLTRYFTRLLRVTLAKGINDQAIFLADERSKAEAARRLGVSIRTLYRKMDALGMNKSC